MMREDKFVQVYVNKGKVGEQMQYIFTVHPSPHRPKGCFSPVHIGTITIDDSNHFTLSTLTEWGKDEHYYKDIELNMKIVYLFTASINKCLTELLTYDIPELSFLAGKLQYREAEAVAVDWRTAKLSTRIVSIALGKDEKMGIPDIPQAQYLLQIVDKPIFISKELYKEIYLKSIMWVNEDYEFTIDQPVNNFEDIKKHLWWEICFPEPITEEVWEERFEEIKNLSFRDGYRLVYMEPLDSIENIPIQVWMYTKEVYSTLPSFYDEESFTVAKTLFSLQKGREL